MFLHCLTWFLEENCEIRRLGPHFFGVFQSCHYGCYGLSCLNHPLILCWAQSKDLIKHLESILMHIRCIDVHTKILSFPFPESHLFTYNDLFLLKSTTLRQFALVYDFTQLIPCSRHFQLNQFPLPPQVFFKSSQYSIHCKKLTRKTVKWFQICIYNLCSTKGRMALVNTDVSKIGISVHLHGLPCAVNSGKKNS